MVDKRMIVALFDAKIRIFSWQPAVGSQQSTVSSQQSAVGSRQWTVSSQQSFSLSVGAPIFEPHLPLVTCHSPSHCPHKIILRKLNGGHTVSGKYPIHGTATATHGSINGTFAVECIFQISDFRMMGEYGFFKIIHQHIFPSFKRNSSNDLLYRLSGL